MARNVLIIFIKNPILGEVKSRLAKDIGEEKALEVYHSLLRKCRTDTMNVNAIRYLYYHQEVLENDDWYPKYYSKKLQSEGDLGERMRNAFREIHEKYEQSSIVLIGSDCYDLDDRIIEEAFRKLKSHDLVFGPANDGGYYLIGMNESRDELFQNIDWSTEKVLDQSLKKAKELKLNYCLLEELIDLDTFDDLKKIKK